MTRRVAILAPLVVAAAVVFPAGRLFLLGPLALWGVVAAIPARRAGRRWPLRIASAAALAFGACVWLGAGYDVAMERAIRDLHAKSPRYEGFQGTRTATVDGPTGPVTVTVQSGDHVPMIAFTHREPPWVGDAPLAALAAAVAREGRLPPPAAFPLRAPIERAGLRALELAFAPKSLTGSWQARAWEAAAWCVRAEQDAHTLATLPAVLVLVLVLALVLERPAPVAPKPTP